MANGKILQPFGMFFDILFVIVLATALQKQCCWQVSMGWYKLLAGFLLAGANLSYCLRQSGVLGRKEVRK